MIKYFTLIALLLMASRSFALDNHSFDCEGVTPAGIAISLSVKPGLEGKVWMAEATAATGEKLDEALSTTIDPDGSFVLQSYDEKISIYGQGTSFDGTFNVTWVSQVLAHQFYDIQMQCAELHI